MNPFVSGESSTQETDETELAELQEFAWDFSNDRFLYNADGTHKIVYENQALEVWIYKALKTERYRYECYKHGIYNTDSDYGIELEQYIGKRKNDVQTATEIMTKIKECLEINPYIKSIDSIDITEIKGDKLTLAITLTSIYGETTTNQTV